VPLLVAGAVADVVGASDVVGGVGLALIITGVAAWRRGWGGVPEMRQDPVTSA
jgi:hypothetical protein